MAAGAIIGIGPVPELLWPVGLRVALVVAIGAVSTIGVKALSTRRSGAAGDGLGAAWSRVAVWAIAAALLLALDAAGALPFGLLMAALAVPAMREVSAAFAAAGIGGDRAVTLVGGTAAILAAAAAAGAGFALGFGFAVLATPVAIIVRADSREVLQRLVATTSILVYVAMPLGLLAVMRWRPDGFALIVWTILVVGTADAAAMYGGLVFGRTRIAPRISPGKTLEGLIAGLAFAVAAAALMRAALPGPGAILYYGSAALVALSGFFGDLVASAIKRAAGVKDFGAALPGHGGIMDRLDSQLYGAPVAFAVAAILWR